MVNSSQNNIAESVQEQLAVQQERWVTFANKALENATKLLELNWTLTKDVLDESTVAAQQLLAAKNPQELFSIDSEAARTNFSRMLSYAGAVTNMTTAMQAELIAAAQTQFGDAFNKATHAIAEPRNDPQNHAPNPFEMMKVAMENAKGGYEQWVATTQKVAQAMEGKMNMMPTGGSGATKRAHSSAKKNGA